MDSLKLKQEHRTDGYSWGMEKDEKRRNILQARIQGDGHFPSELWIVMRVQMESSTTCSIFFADGFDMVMIGFYLKSLEKQFYRESNQIVTGLGDMLLTSIECRYSEVERLDGTWKRMSLIERLQLTKFDYSIDFFEVLVSNKMNPFALTKST